MVGKAREHFEIWEAEHREDDDGGYQLILDKIKDYARRKKLDHSAVRSGSNDMDVGEVNGGHGHDHEGWSE